MKKLLLILLCMFPVRAIAGDVTFAWDYETMPSGFEMTVSPTVGTPIIFDCGASPTKTCTVPGIGTGNWTAFVRAYNIGVPSTVKVYSDSSNVVNLTVPVKPPAPTDNRVTGASMASLNFSVPENSVAVVTLTFKEEDGR